ncbi:MAG: helix-turn-helix domain-containing protein [Verrucomicrobiota bacterium]
MNPHHSLLEALAQSQLFHDFQQAFTETTGLPLTLRAVDSWQLPLHGKKNENRFCGIMAGKSRSCAACLQMQQRLADNAAQATYTTACDAGMFETAVPVKMGEKLLGFLQTGQVFCAPPSAAQFDRTAKLASDWGLDADVPELRDAYFSTPVMPSQQYEGTVHMLNVFAEHLGMVGKQIQVHEETAEPPVITKAKQYINDHHAEDLSLEEVAKAVHMSMFYFCKTFKRALGINFTEYLSQVRVEKAKNLLLNRNLRVSEIAYEVGFQSLTHFNRVFRKMVGESPSQYRDRLPKV